MINEDRFLKILFLIFLIHETIIFKKELYNILSLLILKSPYKTPRNIVHTNNKLKRK